MKIKLPIIALISFFVLSLLVSAYTSSLSNTRSQTEFSAISKELIESIQFRVQIYIEMLYAGKALFDSSEEVNRAEWRSFYKGLTIGHRYPGLQAYEFIQHVPKEGKSAFIESVRNDTSLNQKGYPEFTIWPEGERNSYVVVNYLEPFEGNEKAFGFDVTYEKKRLLALGTSRDTGSPTSTPRIKLVQSTDPKESSFVIYLPVYQKEMRHGTIEERREAFLGFASGVFNAEELLKDVIEKSYEPLIEFAIYDTELTDNIEDKTAWAEQHLLYSSSEGGTNLLTSKPSMKNTFSLPIAGRNWTVITLPKPAFHKNFSSYISILIFLAGTIISFLIFLTLRSVEESRESNERFQHLTDSAYEGIFIHDKGIILDVNKAIVEIFGYQSKNDFIGKDAMSFISSDSIEIAKKKMGQSYEDPYEINVIKKDGTICPMEIRGRNTRFKGADVRVVAVNDLSERKAHEESLKNSLKEKEQLLEMLRTNNTELVQTLSELKNTQAQLIQSEKMSSLGELVAGLTHEINTPIGIGVTAASFLHGHTKDTNSLMENNKMKKSDLESYFSSAMKSTDLILSNLRRTAELIGSFKVISSDKARDDLRAFNLRQYLENIVRSLKPAIKKGNYEVSIHCPEDMEITQNPGSFAQIVTNLIMNSINHAFKEKKGGTMTLSVVNGETGITLTYHDNGVGIPEENLSKIFEPFFTTTRGQGGTGLGLHIIYNIVHQSLNGTIECQSSPTEGTTFTISFPPYSKDLNEERNVTN